MLIIPLLKGVLLGGSICMLSYVADNTISNQSLLSIQKNVPGLYHQAWEKVKFNMFIISPIMYVGADRLIINHEIDPSEIEIQKVLMMLLIQNIMYYNVHKTFHNIPKLYKYHKFHHKFDNILVPSLGNAVSYEEFVVAYVIPFLIGGLITHPNEITFILPIGIIAILNMMIHCQELKEWKYKNYLVSPGDHIEHHKVRNKHFAAPLLNIDNIKLEIEEKTTKKEL